MKLKTVASIFFGFTVFAAITSAQPIFALQSISLAQRDCTGDVFFTKDTETVAAVVCSWDAAKNDANMSLTTHFIDPSIKSVYAYCDFIPANSDSPHIRSSFLKDVTAKKAAKITGLNINSQLAQFNLLYTGTNDLRDSIDNNANILFQINNNSYWAFAQKATYNDQDKISCKFTVVR